MTHRKQKAKVHMPGSLADRYPMPAEQLARFDRLSWEANPERYARRTWALIKQWAEG